MIEESTGHRVDSEVGPLRTVLLHRPGPELKRLTPRNADQLLFDGIPWVDRAQAEHDAFAALLAGRGVEVLLLGDLLVTALRDGRAHSAGVHAVVDELRLGLHLADGLRSYLSGVPAETLAMALTAGMTFEELPVAEGASLVRKMHQPHDFAIDPLPNLLFTRDSSVWIGDRVAVSSLSLPARRRESAITDLIYAYHPRFRHTSRAYGAHSAPVEGGDVLALAPGVVVAYERNVETNARLEAAGIEVLRISGSELGSGRGGPRCMSCPVNRDALPEN